MLEQVNLSPCIDRWPCCRRTGSAVFNPSVSIMMTSDVLVVRVLRRDRERGSGERLKAPLQTDGLIGHADGLHRVDLGIELVPVVAQRHEFDGAIVVLLDRKQARLATRTRARYWWCRNPGRGRRRSRSSSMSGCQGYWEWPKAGGLSAPPALGLRRPSPAAAGSNSK